MDAREYALSVVRREIEEAKAREAAVAARGPAFERGDFGRSEPDRVDDRRAARP